MPLTDAETRNAPPREKAYRLIDGFGMYLEVAPARYLLPENSPTLMGSPFQGKGTEVKK